MPDSENKNENEENEKYDDIIETEAWDVPQDGEEIGESTEVDELDDEFNEFDELDLEQLLKILKKAKPANKGENSVNLKFFFRKRIITVPIIIVIALAVFSIVIWAISAQSPTVADFFTNNISFVMRLVLTGLTYYIPFSVAELIVYLSVPVAIYLLARFIYGIVKSENEKIITALKGLIRCIAFVCLAIFIFNFTFSICYSATPINEKMEFERRLIKPNDLYNAMSILIEQANEAAHNIKNVYMTGSTVMPYNFNELNIKLNEAYTKLLQRHDITKQIKVRAKPVVLSTQLSKMHITGIYFPFTGEANVNIDFPDYHLPFTTAHEMAHLMGIAREDEANFAAFLVCLHSSDNYIRYSGLVNMIEYLRGPLYRAEENRYYELMYAIDPIILKEMAAYREFFDKYRDTQISKVASTVNDTYLKAQRQEAGEKSYGLVVDLATIYILEIYDYAE